MQTAEFDPSEILKSALTISDKVRKLNAQGYTRRQIADLVDRSYQQVRQILVDDDRRAGRRSPAASPQPALASGTPGSGMAEPSAAIFRGVYRLDVDGDGAVRLPPEVQQVLGVRPGGILISELGEDRLVILSGRAAAQKARALVAGLGIDPSRILSEELIAERRAEAARDDG